MPQDNKKRRVISYENMSDELAAAFNDKYPGGFNDWFQDLTKYTNEMPDSICLVKIKVETDDLDDIERWLEGEENAENEQVAGTSADADAGAGTLPDDNISQYGGDDDGVDGD